MWRRLVKNARTEFVAFPIAILAAFLSRAESFSTSMGPDELSLLVMAKSIIDGAFPYEIYWDVRAPLAYFIALPSALFDDAFAALATLRLLTVFVQAGATWTFFCLFRRTLGAPGRGTRPARFDEHGGSAPPCDAQPFRHGHVPGSLRVPGGGYSGQPGGSLLLGSFGGSVALGDGSIGARNPWSGSACAVRGLVTSPYRALRMGFTSCASFSRHRRHFLLLGTIRYVRPNRVPRSVRGD